MNNSQSEMMFPGEFDSDPIDRNASSRRHRYLSPEQQRLMIRASAGTGKTFQLANRFVTLLRDTNADRILAATFSRKAAGEIIERVLVTLARAATHARDLEQLSRFTGNPALTQPECLSLLKNLTHQLHRLRIGTLDSFFARLAGSFALELKLPSGWRIIDDHELAYFRDLAVDHVLREGSLQEFKTLVHQLAKGTTLRSVHTLITDAIDSFHDLFSRSEEPAWHFLSNMKPPTQAKLEAAIEDLAVLKVIDKTLESARDADLELIRKENWEELYKKGLTPKVLSGGDYRRKSIPQDLKEAYRKLETMIRAKWMFLWAEQISATYRLLQRYDSYFRQVKFDHGVLQFDDITKILASSLGGQSTASVSHRMDGAIDHVLLDEFQDTSVVQWNVVRRFAEAATNSAHTSFFCVGDAKQAIYGWRGGEAGIFDALTDQLPGLLEQPLNTSYRSSQVVIDAVNDIFQRMVQHDGFEKELKAIRAWSAAFPKHTTARAELPGHVRLMTSSVPTDVDFNPRETKPLFDELHRNVAQMVAVQLRQHPTGSIGILTRKNDTIKRLIFELNELGIDASEEGGNPLTDSAAVQLILSLCTLADHPGHTIARFHVAESPLGEIVGCTKDADAYDVALRFRTAFISDGFGAVVNRLATQLQKSCNARELKRLQQLVKLADDFAEMNSTLRASEFVTFVEEQRVQEPTDSRVRVMTVHQSKGLQFDTVYLVEFDQAILHTPSVVSWRPGPATAPEVIALYRSQDLHDLFPQKLQDAFQQTTERTISEALCLMYVALTRAIHSLQIVITPRVAKSDERALPKTYAGLVRAALAPNQPLEPETVLYEAGDPDWSRTLPEQQHSENVPAVILPAQIQFQPVGNRKTFQRVTPSGTVHKQKVRLETVLPTGSSLAREKGTLTHAWLEQISWLDDGLPTTDSLDLIRLKLGYHRLSFDEQFKEFRQMIGRPEIKQLLSRDSYAASLHALFPGSVLRGIDSAQLELTVQNERRFAVIQEDTLLNGSIDRLVTISHAGHVIAADIIDFKTDQLPSDLVASHDRVEYYREQLLAYRTAAAAFLDLHPERIVSRLALLANGRVINIPSNK